LARCPAKVESVSLRVGAHHFCQFGEGWSELRFVIVSRDCRRIGHYPRIGFSLRRWNDEQRVSIHHISKQR
jgi:hypothetical protein